MKRETIQEDKYLLLLVSFDFNKESLHFLPLLMFCKKQIIVNKIFFFLKIVNFLTVK